MKQYDSYRTDIFEGKCDLSGTPLVHRALMENLERKERMVKPVSQ